MITVKIYENEEGIFNNAEDAIKYMYDTNFEKEISVYDINTNKAFKKTKEIYNAIKEYNKGKPLDDQILPSNPFGYRGILGCLGVQCYSITLGTYKRNHELVALFTGFDESVLNTSKETAHIRPGLNALSSLALMSNMIYDHEIK